MASLLKKLSHKGKLKVSVSSDGEEVNGSPSANGVSKHAVQPTSSKLVTEAVDELSEVYKKGKDNPIFTETSKDHLGRLWPSPAGFLEQLQSEMDVREDDTYLVTFPKCGTSWLTEIVDGIICKGDFNAVAERRKESMSKMPRIEIMVKDATERIETINSLPSPRTIVTHLSADIVPSQIFEKKCKTIVLMRNPKDVLVSYYHFHRMNSNFGSFEGSFQTFFESFIAGQLFYGDVFDYHLGWWKHHKQSNVLIIFYENLKKDLHSGVERVAKFLGHSLTPTELGSVVENTTFEKQKENCHEFFNHIPIFQQEISNFFRKGQIGDWQNTVTVAQNKLMDQIIKKKLGKSDLKFNYGD